MMKHSTLPYPYHPPGRRVTAEEAEKFLLEKLKESGDDNEEALWNLAHFYSCSGRQPEAIKYVERLITATDDPEKQASYYLALGQLMEQMQDYAAAISYYSHAFSLEPINNPTWYLINNNLGYCLNHFKKHTEAEGYCRNAIRIDQERHNAYKNLGIALEGQGKYPEAAESYFKAVKANAGDPRAFGLLEKLVVEHPEIQEQLPDILDQLKRCQDAVRAVAELRRKSLEE
jgi:tetratricopeptide (TPR) repeat protein